MVTNSFDLRDEPWIRVRTDSGIELLSIRDVFERAGQIKAIAGEIPTQDIAVLRVLLVILSRALDGDEDDVAEIARRLWTSQQLPMQPINDYLDGLADRFDLWHPVMPFLQVAGLAASKTSGLTKLITDVPDGHEFFTTRTATANESLSYAEATRWLIHAQATDPSGIKTGAIGDDRVKGGRGYPIGTGWMGRCGLIVVEGRDLKETLILNLVLDNAEADEGDLPVWERDPLTSAPEPEHTSPTGWRDIFTWPSRRILLYRNHDKVTDVLLCNGDKITPQNRHQIETMSLWRRSQNQEKMHGSPTYMPASHDPARSIWRGLPGMLATRTITSGSEPPSRLSSANLEWLARLRAEHIVEQSHPIGLHAVGMSYGTQDASVVSVTDDNLLLRVGVITDPRFRHAVTEAVQRADDAVNALVNLAGNLAAASGRDSSSARSNAREDGFYRLDLPYRNWISQLLPGSDPAEAERVWQVTVRREMFDAARELVQDAGKSAWIGREVRDRHVDSALAEIWFRGAIKQALPLLTIDPEPGTPNTTTQESQ